ncbi:hypothetical protein GL218_01680 [Daldinia childiae]|uniref:uncharacterized protein n=1 Tax=Daldinia childiae TaxID=326645 RepID=UPI001444BFC0|nr:uncharacterized protein GL218_01680 [Daldinia childiae]KAF3063597.1 hypothetical protein GL218_01680 [Daldinia childiae]
MMGYESNQYPEMEPPDMYGDTSSILQNFDFDNPTLTTQFDTLPDFLEPPVAPAVGPLNTHPSHFQNFDPSLAAPEPIHSVSQEFVDPSLLSNTGIVAVPTIQQEQYSTYNSMNIGGPVANHHDFTVASPNYPINYTQYPPQFSPPPQPYQPYQPQYPQPLDSYPTPRRISDVSILSSEYDDGQVENGKRDIYALRRSRIPSPVLIPHSPPLKRPMKGPNGLSLKNGQIPRVTRKKDSKPDPREWYGAPPPPPESWGPRDKNGRPLFKYTECGELERGKTYSERELRRYLYGPKQDDLFMQPRRLQGVPEVEDKIRQGLTLWIGWVAPQSNDRYPYGTQSQKCRFADCEDPQNTIRTGFPRIILDERMNDDGEVINPYHNAGYMHLYCFEQHFDLVDAMIHLDIRPDERNFKHEDNIFKLTRHFSDMRSIIDLWWFDEYPKFVEARSRGKRRDHRNYKNSLSYRLVLHALENSTDARLKLREERGGANMAKHKGDIARQKFLKECRNFGLLDDNDDPIAGAHLQLPGLILQKRQAKKLARTVGRKDTPEPAEVLPPPTLPSPASSGYQSATDCQQDAAHSSPCSTHLSINSYSPAARSSSPYAYLSPKPVSPSLPPPHHQQPPSSPVISSPVGTTARKRDRDEVLMEDQNIDLSYDSIQDDSNKKPRINPSPAPPSTPQHVYTPVPDHTGQYDEVNNGFGNVPAPTEASHSPTPPPSEPLGLNTGSDIVREGAEDNHDEGEKDEISDGNSVEFLDSMEFNESDDLFGGSADEAGLADLISS